MSPPRSSDLPLVLIQDSREQCPLVFPAEVSVIVKGLPIGDYTAVGLEGEVAIERKSVPDLVHSLTFERPRFLRELARLAELRSACVVIEGDLHQLHEHDYRSQATPTSMVGSVVAMHSDYVPFIFASTPAMAADFTYRLLRRWVRRKAVEGKAA
jgi:DNA excision repair protein ERCC-4